MGFHSINNNNFKNAVENLHCNLICSALIMALYQKPFALENVVIYLFSNWNETEKHLSYNILFLQNMV